MAAARAEFTVTFRDAFGNPCSSSAAGSLPQMCQSGASAAAETDSHPYEQKNNEQGSGGDSLASGFGPVQVGS